MLLMCMQTWDPKNRDEIARRVVEKGTSWVPEGIKLHGWWVVPGGARGFSLMECDDLVLMEQAALHWSDLLKIDYFPVTDIGSIMGLMKEL